MKNNDQLPLDRDTEEFARATLGRNMPDGQSLYEALLKEVLGEASPWFEPYEGSWKDVKNYGNGEMVRWYAGQWYEKIGAVEANIAKMGDEANPGSLIGRITDYLDTQVVPDLERGPIFASGLLGSANGRNLLNVIDGLLEENETKRLQAAQQNRKGEYEAAENAFENAGVLGSKSRFAAYNGACEAHHEALLWLGGRNLHDDEVMGVYERIEGLLRKLRVQVEQANAERYGKLARITRNLSETFELNRDALAAGMAVDDSDFVKMIMTIEELKPALDQQIEELDIIDVLGKFITAMIDSREREVGKDVADFFMSNVFRRYASLEFHEFLIEKCGSSDPYTVYDAVRKEWLDPFVSHGSRPCFPFNGLLMAPHGMCVSKWSMAPFAFSQMAVPEPIGVGEQHPVQCLYWRGTDRFTVLTIVQGIPFAVNADALAYEADPIRSHPWMHLDTAGLHIYEDEDGKLDMPFGNWRKLPPLNPESLVGRYFAWELGL